MRIFLCMKIKYKGGEYYLWKKRLVKVDAPDTEMGLSVKKGIIDTMNKLAATGNYAPKHMIIDRTKIQIDLTLDLLIDFPP